jgi:RNA polymerase sigma factor (sigma-70 family)
MFPPLFAKRAPRSPRQRALMDTVKDLQVTTRRPQRDAPRRARARRSDEQMAELFRRAARGDHGAWDELVAEYSGLIWSVVRAFGLNDADAADVSQNTWLRLFVHLHRIRNPACVGAWLATTARRECIQLRRRARDIPQGDELPEQVNEGPAPCEALLVDERDRALWSALGDLPLRDRRLLRLLMSEPAPSYVEISAELRMPCGSIGPTRARALERLRRAARRRGLTAGE